MGRETTVWVSGSFGLPTFYSVLQIELDGQRVIEIDLEPIELTSDEKTAIIDMIWQWEIWETLTVEGTCMVDSLAQMLDLSRDAIIAMFRRTRRNPSIQEDAVKTLEENGYNVHIFGPEGFGYRESRRLVTMSRKDDPKSGHVVLIYENDEDVFDSNGIFKKVADHIMSGNWGYDRGSVLIIEKK